MILDLPITLSTAEISVGVNGLVELTSKSAVSSARASVATARLKFWISERSATTDPTPIAMHKKKNKSRRHDERISRLNKLKINCIKGFHQRKMNNKNGFELFVIHFLRGEFHR